MKSDNSIRNICVLAIKRSTIPPIDFPLTRLFETETLNDPAAYLFKIVAADENELPIVQTVVDALNYTLITTRQITTCVKGVIKNTKAINVQSVYWGDFKGYFKTEHTVGHLVLEDNRKMEIFIETGRASMITIHCLRKLIWRVKKIHSIKAS